jgi:hypothetical protein
MGAVGRSGDPMQDALLFRAIKPVLDRHGRIILVREALGM